MNDSGAVKTAIDKEIFTQLKPSAKAREFQQATESEQKRLISWLSPDDLADLIQESDEANSQKILGLMDQKSSLEVEHLLHYDRDVAGGVMNTRFAAIGTNMSVTESLASLKEQALGDVETIYNIYVLDEKAKLVGVISLRNLIVAEPYERVGEIMKTDFVKAYESEDQEVVARRIAKYDLNTIPVVEEGEVLKGIITVDDIVDIIEEEATEDVHKLGGSQAIGRPYMDAPIFQRIYKRTGWLIILFLGSLLTTNAIAGFQEHLSNQIAVAIFIPLIINSGGNAGTQATTIVIRALALDEVKVSDWMRIMGDELIIGITIGLLLGLMGVLRVTGWEMLFGSYGETFRLLSLSVGLSILLVVTWGTTLGALMPLAFRSLGLDPAGASAPMVGTIIDITGLMIYLSVSLAIMSGA